MKLDELTRARDLTILGINSGTSADGIDLAAVRFRGAHAGTFIDGMTIPYSRDLRRLVLATADSRLVDPEQLVRLDNLLGITFGRAAQKFIEQLRRKRVTVDAIASHGQTVRHIPSPKKLIGTSVHGTLQIGSIDQIARATGKVVVGDFRQADVALGNEGAPITVAAVARLLGSRSESRMILNVGGMANYFYLPANARARIMAADTGPGNVLSDLICQELFGQKYDRNGARASRGEISIRLLKSVQAGSFRAHRTRSTGRELYGASLAERLIAHGRKMKLTSNDILATAVELTALSVAARLMPILRRDRSVRKLYLTGGGIHNSFLTQRLETNLGISVATVAQLGMDPDLLEAASFAVIGLSCLRGEAMPTLFTGKGRQQLLPVLGRIAQPPLSR